MRNYIKLILPIIYSILFASSIYAQPELDLSSNRLRYRDIFDRIENVYFINKGDQPLVIDSIYYNSNLYFVRFDKYYGFPFILQPGDSTLMDCIVSGYQWVTTNDTSDTMYIVNNGKNPMESLKIEIQFFHDKQEFGTFTGKVTDGTNPINKADVYFLLEGNYMIRKTVTDANGNYNIDLPNGYYTIAAAADSFYLSFYDNKPDPFKANIIKLESNTTQNINLTLDNIDYSGNSVSGKVLDSLSHALLKRAILVLRKGDHTPNKIVNNISKNANVQDTSRTYTALLNYNGTYSVEGIKDPGYYYIQSFSDYYVPTYYGVNNASVFWQQADSIYINSNLTNLDIQMPRDSSIGGGSISGNILTSGSPSTILNNVLVYAKSTTNNMLYNYGLSKENGSFRVADLPYGNYDLIAQKIGLQDAYVNNINITPFSFDTTGINISFILASVEGDPEIPNTIELYQNYPNPFNPTTKIRYSILSLGASFMKSVQLKIYDVLGREVATLVNQNQSPGNYEVTFDASKISSGKHGLASGVYIYQLRVSDPSSQVPCIYFFKKAVAVEINKLKTRYFIH